MIDQLECVNVSTDMMVSLVKELSAQRTATTEAHVFPSDSWQIKQVECTKNLGMPKRVLVVFAISDIVGLRVNSKNAHLALILSMALGMKRGETVREEVYVITMLEPVTASQDFTARCVNIKQL